MRKNNKTEIGRVESEEAECDVKERSGKREVIKQLRSDLSVYGEVDFTTVRINFTTPI